MSPFAACALFALTLAATVACGGPLIAALRRLAARQRAYEDAPQSHAAKTGTPTMGGVLFLIPLALALGCARDRGALALAALALGCAAVGAIDDLAAIRAGRNKGLGARVKFGATVLVGGLFLALVPPAIAAEGVLLPVGAAGISAPTWLWAALALLAILATTHAVNLTDGLDGLASGTLLPPLLVIAAVAARRQVYGVAFVDVALAAGVLGFLVFNRYPARVFMGDTGSLLLGGALAGSAILAGATLLLPLIGGVFVAEALSVIIQVAYFKRTRKRIFRMSPLHHHFELGGWPETAVTQRFWTVSALLSLAGAAVVR